MLRLWIGMICLMMSGLLAVGQNPYASHFQEAYQRFPNIPRGMLEAVSYTQTHVRHLMPDEAAGCSGIPQYVGVMGLIADGKGVFRENMRCISSISGTPMHDLTNSPKLQIEAFAYAYNFAHHEIGPFGNETPDTYLPVLTALSELPLDTTVGSDYALNSYLYSVLSFLNNPTHAATFGFPVYHINLRQVFGANYDVLSSNYVTMSSQGITNGQGQPYGNSRMAAEYPNALWNPAATCNYSSRSGIVISAVTVHTVQGSYAGCISWFKNCNAGVSAHYVIRSSDGQVTQMVPETNKAWHVGSENPYTVGIEHEGYINDPSWYTQAMYQSSANLVKYLAGKYAINPLSTYKGAAQVVLNSCYRIKGHIHYPNQTHTDPGTNWNWALYYNLINDTIATNRIATCSGTFTDNGGTSGNYTDLTKYLTVIQPTGAQSVTITFSSFSLEQGYDSLYIYDGNGTGGTLLGRYTGTQNPGTVTANSGVMSLLFTSDCNTNGMGWAATYSCTVCPGTLAIGVDSLMPVTCNPGYIRVTGTGGTPPYSYVWGNGTPGPVRTNMPAGAFTVSVTDGAGCTVSKIFSIPSIPNPSLQLSTTPITCNGGSNAVVTATPSAGTAPYSYVWNVPGSTATLANVGAGSYSLTLTDAAGCTATASTTITQPDSIALNLDSLSDASCQGGYIAISATGGNGALSYLWNDGYNAPIRMGLGAGNYTITATDASGCMASKGFVISSISNMAVTVLVDTLTCPGDTNGAIYIAITGGTSPYTYTWNSGQTAAQISNLSPNTYSLTVTDFNGCLTSTTVVLAQPDSLKVTPTVQNINCNGHANGAITLTPTSGKAPFLYQWNIGSGPALINLQAGNYFATITDARGCSITDSFTIIELAPLTVWNAQESYDSTGLAWDSITGGSAPYNIEHLECWIYLGQIAGDPAKECSLRVSDAYGCVLDTVYPFGQWQGVNDIAASNINIYPNPTNGAVNVTWQKQGTLVRYYLVNVLGQSLANGEIAATQTQLQLNLQPYAMGSYWLVMENSQGQRTIHPLLRAH